MIAAEMPAVVVLLLVLVAGGASKNVDAFLLQHTNLSSVLVSFRFPLSVDASFDD